MLDNAPHDAHIHLTSLRANDENSIVGLLTGMDKVGVECAAVVTPSSMAWDNEVTFGAAENAPNRLLPIIRIDLEAKDAIEQVRHGLDRGARALRLTLLDRDGPESLPAMSGVAQVLQRHGAALELHARPDQLPLAACLAQQYPALSLIIDHLGRPDSSGSPSDYAYANFRALASFPNVFAKTPNLGYFSRLSQPYEDLTPYLDYVLDDWGAERVMWGSDWPLLLTYGEYADALSSILMILRRRSRQERRAVLRTTFETVLNR